MQALIEHRQGRELDKLIVKIDEAYVVDGVRTLIERIESYGLGGWQINALLKCYTASLFASIHRNRPLS